LVILNQNRISIKFRNGKKKIEIMDTTPVMVNKPQEYFSAAEKLTIAQLLLEELNVDRIEIASARVSEGEFQGVGNAWTKDRMTKSKF
jgi:D-citramalate synthase